MRNTRDRIIAGRYVVRELLGAGGMGSVYRAVDLADGHDVALKMLHARHRHTAAMTERFAAEVHAGTCVHHPNVVAVRGSGTSTDGRPFLVMDLIRGQPLDELVAQHGELPLRRVTAIVGQLLAGLEALHVAGLVHGDVKTANVLVAGKGAVKLVDLGLARPPGGPDTGKASVASGTPEYMAPEVIRGEPARPASDVYGAGVVLYELLTGTPPFEGVTPREILRRHLDDDVVPPSLRCPERGIPRDLERAVMIALAKQPGARYPSAAAFAAALAAATPAVEPPSQLGAQQPAPSATAPTRPWTLHELPTCRTRRSVRGHAPARARDTARRAALGEAPTHPQLACVRRAPAP